MILFLCNRPSLFLASLLFFLVRPTDRTIAFQIVACFRLVHVRLTLFFLCISDFVCLPIVEFDVVMQAKHDTAGRTTWRGCIHRRGCIASFEGWLCEVVFRLNGSFFFNFDMSYKPILTFVSMSLKKCISCLFL